jgi:hypothetical protein
MGVWAMKTRLHYYVQSLYKSGTESESPEVRSLAYREAQRLRKKLQIQISQIVMGNG